MSPVVFDVTCPLIIVGVVALLCCIGYLLGRPPARHVHVEDVPPVAGPADGGLEAMATAVQPCSYPPCSFEDNWWCTVHECLDPAWGAISDDDRAWLRNEGIGA